MMNIFCDVQAIDDSAVILYRRFAFKKLSSFYAVPYRQHLAEIRFWYLMNKIS